MKSTGISDLRMLVVSTCTGEKAVRVEQPLTLEDFQDPARLKLREASLAQWRMPSRELYTGQQHVLLMNGVEKLRQRFGQKAIEVCIISAGYGLIPETRVIVPYDVTFEQMTTPQAVAWGRNLRIPADVRAMMRGFPLVIFLLGCRYLRAIEPPLIPAPSQRLVFLTGRGWAEDVAGSRVAVVLASIDESKRYGVSTIALKGKMFSLFCQGLVRGGQALWKAILGDDSPKSFIRAVELGVGQDDRKDLT